MRQDSIGVELCKKVDDMCADLKDALVSRDMVRLKEVINGLEALYEEVLPPCKHNAIRENVEMLVVAFSVAMAFRAYFFQPFAIPTGSMMPSLYGIHSRPVTHQRTVDRMPFRPFTWLFTGEWYCRYEVPGGNVVAYLNDKTKPGRTRIVVGGVSYYIPSDAVRRGDGILERIKRVEASCSNDPNTPRIRMNPGDLLWEGLQVSGDQVFVNRLLWNFRAPRRGEVMVFTTNGLGLDGAHYIKRMCGLPGEALSINPPQLQINGDAVREPRGIGRMVGCEDDYEGYRVIGNVPAVYATSRQPLRYESDVIKLTSKEYFAMGDNSASSYDSRYWGPVPSANLVGPSQFVYWPPSKRWGTNLSDLNPSEDK